MYKDKDKQREANRERQRRYKAKQKGVTEGVTEKALSGVSGLDHLEGETVVVLDDGIVKDMIEDVCKNGGEYSFTTVKGEVQDIHHTKPKRGDEKPHPMFCVQHGGSPACVKANEKHGFNCPRCQLKRGKDIKCFADLPPDVQRTIDRMSVVDGKIDKDEKAKRTAAAIKYQHLFPDSFYCPTKEQVLKLAVLVTGKPGDADYNGICTPEWRAERGR